MNPIGINRVPLAAPGTEQPPNTTRVQPGETTLRQVAQRLLLLEQQLMALNPQLPNPQHLNPGQVLNVPAPGAAGSSFVSLKTAFRKADLGDPDKANRAVGAAVNQLLNDCAAANGLSKGDRSRIAAVMKNDPVIRGRILGQLKKVLN